MKKISIYFIYKITRSKNIRRSQFGERRHQGATTNQCQIRNKKDLMSNIWQWIVPKSCCLIRHRWLQNSRRRATGPSTHMLLLTSRDIIRSNYQNFMKIVIILAFTYVTYQRFNAKHFLSIRYDSGSKKVAITQIYSAIYTGVHSLV